MGYHGIVARTMKNDPRQSLQLLGTQDVLEGELAIVVIIQVQ
jgi:hypothetical protein